MGFEKTHLQCTDTCFLSNERAPRRHGGASPGEVALLRCSGQCCPHGCAAGLVGDLIVEAHAKTHGFKQGSVFMVVYMYIDI